jgi:hypothetical protein
MAGKRRMVTKRSPLTLKCKTQRESKYVVELKIKGLIGSTERLKPSIRRKSNLCKTKKRIVKTDVAIIILLLVLIFNIVFIK